LNQRKKIKAEPSRLIPRKPAENREPLFVQLNLWHLVLFLTSKP